MVPKGCRTISAAEYHKAVKKAEHVYVYVQYSPDGYGEYINVTKTKARALIMTDDEKVNVLWMQGSLFIGGRG